MTDSTKRAAALLEHWRDRLHDRPALRLPADHPRTGTRVAPPALHAFQVPAAATVPLAVPAAARGGTLADALFTASQVLLSRLSQQPDLLLGLATDHQPGPVPVRATVDPEQPFVDLLGANVERIAEAGAHHVPWATLARELGGEGAPAQAAVTYRDAPGEPVVDRAAHELTVEFTRGEDGALDGVLAYDPALFDAATVARFARGLLILLEGAAMEPSLPVGRLPLLDEEEYRTLTFDWAVRPAGHDLARGVHELVGDRARTGPGAVAVVTEDGTTTYGELDAHANRIAHLLLDHGVRPGAFVAVCLPRGTELFAALLGVLRAGCAYLPLDPDYPADRLSYMLADAEAPVCLTERRLADRLPAGATEMICLDERAVDTATQPGTAPAVTVGPRDAAYVIYTSGSTGRPKGTVVEHRSITRLVAGADYVSLHEDDVVAQGADATFDAATFEIWGPLVAGARLVVVDKHTLLDPTALIAALRRHEVTTLFLTTAVFNQVVAADPAAFSTLRHVLFGGEAVNSARVAQVLAASPPQRLLHVYGPTETTTYATWHEVRSADGNRAVPIGGPIAGTSVYVLDEQLNPVPTGVVGELHIAGPGVARGYLGRPDLTAERFVDDPFGGDSEDRMYRTGDLVRWLPGGAIEYVGRVDHQVKVRGYRIEPSEIELVLQQHPDVEASVVVAVADGDHKRLVGYVRPVAGRSPRPADLRDFTGEQLPDFMVPAAFVTLDAFPLTPSGKVDRKALPAPAFGAEAEAGAPAFGAASMTSTERTLTDIWTEVLRVPSVGLSDNFYELGGDSILGIMVVSKARKAGLSITAKDVFRRQTIAELAQVAAGAEV
ncbi:amino acid adenylation domain-containing protein [Streptomyces sp. NPDC047315]|uniref:non-ribosomal peptide synthetase n=1 Tax=Streptomyces sp. NPDC047315 TaxID=3155142 RepID=UPI0033C3DB6C